MGRDSQGKLNYIFEMYMLQWICGSGASNVPVVSNVPAPVSFRHPVSRNHWLRTTEEIH